MSEGREIADARDSASPFRAWRSVWGIVLWRGLAAQPIPDAVARQRASGAPLDEPPGDFWLIAANGSVKRTFESEAWSVEDELGAALYIVADGDLVRIAVSDFPRRPTEIREAVMVAGLTPIAADDDATHAWIRDAIAREEDTRAARRREAEAAGRDRVDAIPGARDDFAAGDAFERAQTRLRAQIASHWAPTSEAALRTLVAYGRLRHALTGPWRATLEWAMAPLVHACRRVTYDLEVVRDLGRPREPFPIDGPSTAPTEYRSALEAFSASLGELRAELMRAAEDFFASDALNSSREMQRAAEEVSAARARLERCLSEPVTGRT